MDRIIDAILRPAILVAALGSLIMLLKMLLFFFVPTHWNWYNALAFFGATLVLSAARYLISNTRPLPDATAKTPDIKG